MDNIEAGDGIENHGAAMDDEKKRVKCNYCGKEVGGFNRLKHHLGALGSDVTACFAVPDDVKSFMRNGLLQKKKNRLVKQVGELFHPELPLKRKSVPVSVEPGQCQPNVDAWTKESCENASAGYPKQTPPAAAEKGKGLLEPKLEEDIDYNFTPSCVTEDAHAFVKEETKTETALYAAKCVGRFFYEVGIDPAAIKSPSFQSMVEAIGACGAGYRVPVYEELRGWILQDEIKQVQGHVEEIKSSWGQTGCSILLDGWTDQRGRSLIVFLVECPKGTVFLRSVDASIAIHDVDALVSLLSSVIEEVGAQNLVQVIAHDASCYMEAAGKKLMEKYRTIFWTLCADYCINLILERIGMIDHVKKVLAAAKSITSFLYSHAQPLELMRQCIRGSDLVKTSKLKSVAPFMTLQNLMFQRENLIQLFNSQAWNASVWASRTKGKTTANLVRDPFFWAAVNEVLKFTAPLIGVVHQINKGDKGPMGFLYDAMDRAKEAIKTNLGDEEARYLPIWDAIDDIWDNYLHNPLHSAGYYLNPSLFYSNDFFIDAEVTNGLLSCTIRMSGDLHSQDLIVRQLDAYRAPMGAFAEQIAVDQRTKVSPALWWSLFGGQSPELQRLAIRVLSQTCSSSSRYRLGKKLSEQVHAKGRNCIEQQRLCDMEFVHNNLQLWRSSSNRDLKDRISLDELNPLDDWIVEDSS